MRASLIYGKEIQEVEKANPVAHWHKTYVKGVRQLFGLSKYQMLWITFGKDPVIRYVLALLLYY